MNKLLIDFPDQSFHNKNSLVIYFNKCNMKCKDCNYEKMFKLKNLKKLNLKEIEKFIINNIHFIDEVIITGGEPSIDNMVLRKLIDLCFIYDLECILYSNLLNLPDDIIADVNKIYVDIKGSNIPEISNYTGIPLDEAKDLFNKYKKYKSCNKFIWRIPNNMNTKIDFKNVERYNKENI